MEMTSPSSTTCPSDGELSRVDVDVERVGAADAGLAHAAGDHGGVRGLAAAAGEDALRGDHAGQVVGVGLPADQDDRARRRRPARRARGASRRPPCRRRRRARRATPVAIGVGSPARSKRREHQLGELRAGDPAQRLVEVDDALVDELGGDDERGRRGALADPGLQHPQLAALDGELDVAQVAVVLLQRGHDAEQLVVSCLVEPLQVLQRHGVADAGDDVLALGVGQVVAVDAAARRWPGRG